MTDIALSHGQSEEMYVLRAGTTRLMVIMWSMMVETRCCQGEGSEREEGGED